MFYLHWARDRARCMGPVTLQDGGCLFHDLSYFMLLVLILYGSFLPLSLHFIALSDSHLDKTTFCIFKDQQIGTNTEETLKLCYLRDSIQARSICLRR